MTERQEKPIEPCPHCQKEADSLREAGVTDDSILAVPARGSCGHEPELPIGEKPTEQDMRRARFILAGHEDDPDDMGYDRVSWGMHVAELAQALATARADGREEKWGVFDCGGCGERMVRNAGEMLDEVTRAEQRGREEERTRIVKEAQKHIASHKENAANLSKFEGQEQEARAREMASVYMEEFVWCLERDRAALILEEPKA